ncbi:MAG: hypothetical protein MUF78_08270, partial [Candidatus Edwardsbacteria bacterium]|nr:hypothetical protein [Candidatus Edwardsbacteria bacterium]
MKRITCLMLVTAFVLTTVALASPANSAISSGNGQPAKTMVTGPAPKPAPHVDSRATILYQDFEASNGGFTQVSGNGSVLDDWTWGSTAIPYTATAIPAGTNWWMVNADAFNGINDEYLYSPVIDCST